MLFGVDYYPEHRDKSEWEKQICLMKEANFNVVRMAEFAWSRLEPKENQFDFSWLDEIISLLEENQIQVILGTPTAAPPKWLVNNYDVLLHDKYGRARGFGSRRECCSNSQDYRKRSRIIVEKLAERYGKHPNVIAWQIDNEFGCHGSTRCYCKHCKQEFAVWLKKKYGTIEELNQKYGTVFWSQEYESFEDVILPAYSSCEGDYGQRWVHNPSLDMDFHRFSSDSWVQYQQMQIECIRKYSSYPITHNMMGHFSDIDYYKLGKNLDIVSWDNYIDNQWNHCSYETTSMAHELMRGVKNQNFWVMEQQAGPCGWDMFGGTPKPGQLRLWTYQAIAHGCEGILYFRFQSAPFGMEQYWLGVVDHDGVGRRRFYELQQTGEEIQRLAKLFEHAENVSDVLVVKSYEAVWSHKIKKHTKNFDYRAELEQYYKANLHLGTNPMCGSEEMISNRYKIIYMPAYVIVTETLKLRLEEYVKNGGTLVLGYRSGIKDNNNNMLTQTLPGLLRELAGVTVYEFDASPSEVELSDGFGVSKVWRDILEVETAQVKITYQGEYYHDTPAVTVNSYGKGNVWYVGCDMEESAMERLVKLISKESNVQTIELSSGTEIVRRRVNQSEYCMLLNYTNDTVEMGVKGKSLIDGTEFTGKLDAYGVEILLV